MRRYLHREWDDEHAPAHGLIDAAQSWPMVTNDKQLEGRDEVEEVLPHEARGNLVAAGEHLDLGLVPASALGGLLCHHQPGAAQLGEIGRVALALGDEEGIGVGNGGIVAEDASNSVDEG